MTILTLRCRLEVDLQVRQEGEEPFWYPQAHFLYSHLSPTSLAAGRGVPGSSRLVPLVSRRSQ